jgi:hypothetical protein
MRLKPPRPSRTTQRFRDLLGHVGRFGLIRPQELGRFAFHDEADAGRASAGTSSHSESRRRVAVHRFVRQAMMLGLLELCPNHRLGAHLKLTQRGIDFVRRVDAQDARTAKGGLSFREFQANTDVFFAPDGRRNVGIGTHVANVVLTHFAAAGATVIPEHMMQTGVLTTGEERISDGLIVRPDGALWLEVEATSKHTVELMRSFKPLQGGLTSISVGRESRPIRGVLLCLPQGHPNNWFQGVPRARRVFALLCLWYLAGAAERFPGLRALLAVLVRQRLDVVTSARLRAGRSAPQRSWAVDDFCYHGEPSEADFETLLSAVFVCRPVLRRNHKTLLEMAPPVPLWTAVLQEEPLGSARLAMRTPDLAHCHETALGIGRLCTSAAANPETLEGLRNYIDEVALGHGVSLESVAEAWADKRKLPLEEVLEALRYLTESGEYFVADDAVRTVCKRVGPN